MVTVPKWHHSILWEVCILIYSLIALIFISYSYVDHRWKLLLFMQIHVGYWWKVSRAVAIFTLWNHVQAVDALAPWKSISTSLVRCTYRKCKKSISSNNSVICDDEKASFRHISLMYPAKSYEKIQGRGKALEAEVAGSLSWTDPNLFLHSQS